MNQPIMLVSSTGGHFSELQHLDVFNDPNNIIVSEKKHERCLPLIYGSRSNMLTYPFIFIRNCFRAYKYIKKYKPWLIISTGAHSCVPFFWLAKVFKIKTIYIESFAKVTTPSLTYKLIKNCCDVVVVQHEQMQDVYPGSIYLGGVY